MDPSSHLPLPGAHLHLLIGLADGAPHHGYALMQAVEASSGGTVRMGPATLYGSLRKLVERGLAEEVPPPTDEEDARRRYYRMTGLGRAVLAAEVDRLDRLVGVARTHLAPGTA